MELEGEWAIVALDVGAAEEGWDGGRQRCMAESLRTRSVGDVRIAATVQHIASEGECECACACEREGWMSADFRCWCRCR